MTRLRQIYLCGFMGSGKSTLLKRLAPYKQVGFYDLDDLILKELGEQSVGAVVDKYGWPFFRKKEAEIIESKLKSSEEFVMSLGGGSLTSELVATLNEKATLVWLATPFQVCLDRVLLEEKLTPKRPLLSQGRDFLSKLYEERETLYRLSRVHLFSSNQDQIQSYIDLLEYIKN